MTKKNVLHLIEHLYLGGIERLLEQLAYKTGNKANLFFYTYETKTLEGIGKQIRENGFPVFTYKKKEGRDFQLLSELSRIIKANKIEVIHTHDFGPMEYAIFLKLRFPRIKLIHTQHTMFEFIQNWKYKFFFQFASFFYFQIIAVSKHVSSVLIDQCPLLNRFALKIVSNGVDTDFYSPIKLPKTQSSLNLVSISRISKEKNIEYLFKTCSHLKQKKIPFNFHHAGTSKDPEDIECLKEFSKENGLSEHITLHGFTLNAKEILDLGDIFITSSITEGHPVALLEAMACNKLCFCSDIPAHREIATDEIYFFDLNDDMALANLLINYFNSSLEIKNKEIGARKIIVDNFSLDKMVTSYLSLY